MNASELRQLTDITNDTILPSNYQSLFVDYFNKSLKYYAEMGKSKYVIFDRPLAGTCRELFNIDIDYQFTNDDMVYFVNYYRDKGFEIDIRANGFDQYFNKVPARIHMVYILW